MPRQVLNSERYHVPVPGFSHAVLAPEAGRLLFLSGLTARTADGTIVSEGDPVGQTRQILRTMRAILADADGTLDDVVRIVIYLRDIQDYDRCYEVQREFFGDSPPASTAVQIQRLYDPRQLIEIEATAVLAAHSVSSRGT